MYYRIVIIAAGDPYAYGPAWDTYEQLKLAGHAVELLDADRVPELLGPDGEPNRKLLAVFEQTFKPDYIAYAGETAEEIIAALEGTGVGSAERVRHFVVFGYVGPGNFGDELLFDVLKRRLFARYPGCFISLVGHGTREALERQGVAGAFPNEKAACRAMLNGADALIVFAGLMYETPFLKFTSGLVDLFQDPYSEIAGQAAMVLLAWLCDVPTVFVGMGAGPLGNPDAQALVRLASLAKPRFVTRDAHSAALLREAGVDSRLVQEKADLAFLIDPHDYVEPPAWLAKQGLAPGRYVAVALREDDKPMPDGLFGQVAGALDRLYGETGLVPLFVNFSPEDHLVHEQVMRLMSHGEVAVMRESRDIDETLGCLAHARMTFAMRLHCSILGNLFGLPSVGLDYNDKVGAYYRQMENEDCLCALDASADDMASALSRALEKDLTAVNGHVARNKELAAEAFGILCEVVDARHAEPTAQPRYPRTVSNADLRNRDLQAQLGAALARAEAAEARVRDMESSTTWKMGRALTAVPRLVKRKADGA